MWLSPLPQGLWACSNFVLQSMTGFTVLLLRGEGIEERGHRGHCAVFLWALLVRTHALRR